MTIMGRLIIGVGEPGHEGDAGVHGLRQQRHQLRRYLLPRGRIGQGGRLLHRGGQLRDLTAFQRDEVCVDARGAWTGLVPVVGRGHRRRSEHEQILIVQHERQQKATGRE